MTPEEKLKLNQLEDFMKNHTHNGLGNQRVSLVDLFGLIPTVSAVPTQVPRKVFEQVVFYSSGATYRLYIYDTTNNVWRYTTLT